MLRHFSFPKIWILLVIACVLIGSLAALFLPRFMASVQAPCSKENLTATIQTISPRSATGSTTLGLNTLGKGNRGIFGGVDTDISVDAFVHVYMQQGTACHTAQRGSLSDLKVEQKVKIWSSSGITLTSYPGWLEDVTDIVILE
ncbi:MAG TPA: hypothetical protein VGD98_00545 [Ktedonobacteraceae bacterium]